MHVLREQTQSKGIPRVCLSTANPYKFSASVLEALGQSTEGLDGFECMQALQKFTGMPAPHQLLELKQLPERHLDLCKREQMNSYIEHTAERLLS